jgi:hypothetical protein
MKSATAVTPYDPHTYTPYPPIPKSSLMPPPCKGGREPQANGGFGAAKIQNQPPAHFVRFPP